jgi:3,4-dihydroxy 2-butanone 4-phosphate synthase/GTP cyclohydrolase II
VSDTGMLVGKSGVAEAIADLAAGRAVLLRGSGPTEGACLVFAAAHATQRLVAFTVRHTSGFVRVALAEDDCDRLGLPPMFRGGAGRRSGATVTVDAVVGVSTGISASDRAATLRLLADPDATAATFTRPGHVAPVRVGRDGVLGRAGLDEAASDLARLAGRGPAAVLCEIVSVSDPAELAGPAELMSFAAEHDLRVITLEEVVAHRRQQELSVTRRAEARIPTRYGTFLAVGYDSTVDEGEHLALVHGDVDAACEGVLVAVHRECLIGDALGSLVCGCSVRLDAALAAAAAEGRGVVVYLRAPAHRGGGMLTCPNGAAVHRTAPVSDVVRHILADLGVGSVGRDAPDDVVRLPAASMPRESVATA